MLKIIYQKFLSTGFLEANMKLRIPKIRRYGHNYKKFLPSDRNSTVLDIGSGMGEFLEFLAEESYDNILGVDISEEAVDFCREKGMQKVRLIDNLSEFLSTAPVYDLIVMNDVIEHIEKNDLLTVLQRVYEHLSYSGQLIVKTGNMASMTGLRYRYDDFTRDCGFTDNSLKQVLKATNFVNVRVYPFVPEKNGPWKALKSFFQKFSRARQRCAYALEFSAAPKILDEVIFAVARKG